MEDNLKRTLPNVYNVYIAKPKLEALASALAEISFNFDNLNGR